MKPSRQRASARWLWVMAIAVSMSAIGCTCCPSYAQQRLDGGGISSGMTGRVKDLLQTQDEAGDLHEIVRACMNGRIKQIFNLTGPTTPEEVNFLCAEGTRRFVSRGKPPLLETVKAYINAQRVSISNPEDRSTIDPEIFMNSYVKAALDNKPTVAFRVRDNSYEVKLLPAISYILSYAYAALNPNTFVAGVETASHQDAIDSLWFLKIPAGGIRQSALAGVQQARSDLSRERR